MADFNTWKNAVLGVGLDVDRAYGNQCTDVALSWAMACFPGVAWTTLVPPVTGAKDMFNNYNPTYFERITNDPNDANQLPKQGDIVIFNASPEAGYSSTYVNPWGHVGVCDSAGGGYFNLIQQDGSTSQSITRLVQRPYRYTRCLGWLRPRAGVSAQPAPPPPAGDPRIGKTLYLHPVPEWSVYRIGQQPIRTRRIGFLRPILYRNGPNGKPGLTYRIEGVSKWPNTVTIKTDTYGLVDIYVDGDAEIL